MPLGVGLTTRQTNHTVTHTTDKRPRSEEHTSELQSQFRISYAVFCLKKKKKKTKKKKKKEEKKKEEEKKEEEEEKLEAKE